MKIIIKTVSMVFFISFFLACVPDDDYSAPSNLGQVENVTLSNLIANNQALSIEQVKNIFVNGNPATQITSNVYVKGYVSSSDASGNFYKELFIQDSPTNPTSAIKLTLNMSDIFGRYNFGREVYINLKNMYVGEVRTGDGVTTIGENINLDGEVEAIKENTALGYSTVDALGNTQVFEGCILRSAVTEIITPLPLSLATVGNKHIGMFVSVDAQFPENLNGELFVNSADAYDTTRILQDCLAYGYIACNLVLETSTFANFKDIPLPSGGGNISGVVSKNYNGSQLVMSLNTVTDVNFDSARCNVADVTLFNDIISENFNTAINNSDFDFVGWTNFNEEGNKVWKEKVLQENGFAEFTAYNSNNPINIGWLISPSINLENHTDEVLSFTTSQKYLDSPENTVKLYISNNFDGTNVLDATWEELGARIASGNDSWEQWVYSGLVNLSPYSGTIHIAFKYIGSGTTPNLDGTLRLDAFKVEGI